MKKRYIFGLFLSVFVMFCVADESKSLTDMLKSFEAEKVKADAEVEAARKNMDDIKARSMELRGQFLKSKKSLRPDTFNFSDKGSKEKIAELKAELKELDEKRAEVLKQINKLLESDEEYNALKVKSDTQLKEIRELQAAQPLANMRFTKALKKQNEINNKILDLKKRIKAGKKESIGDNI